MAKKTKYLTNEIKATSRETDGRIAIEGYANKAITDSIGDYMVPSGAKLERFQKNPIMFFNHNRDYPIGKVVAWKAEDGEGFWIRGEISNSDEPKIKFVRDLIEEGILKTFSIGYNENNAEKQSDGSRKVTDWELHEVSVVSIPMNAESTFGLAKSLKSQDFESALKILRAAKAEGDVIPPKPEGTPAPAAGDDETPCEVCGESPCTCEQDGCAGGTRKPEDEDGKVVPPADGEVPPKPEGEDDVPQTPTEEDEAAKNAFEQCVTAKIPVLIDEGKPEDQAVALAISQCQSEGKCSLCPTDEMWKCFVELAGTRAREKQATMIPNGTEPVNSETPPAENDVLTLGRQIVGLLTQLVAKIDTLTATLSRVEGDETPPADTPAVPPVAPSMNEQERSSLANIAKMFDSIDQELKAIGA